jgi:hypothetical protein
MTIHANPSREVFFSDHEIIVSKTDLKGRITYANTTFCRIAGYTEAEVLGQAHSIVRHPDMPRAVFKVLWDTIAAGREIFARMVRSSRIIPIAAFPNARPSNRSSLPSMRRSSPKKPATRTGSKRLPPAWTA